MTPAIPVEAHRLLEAIQERVTTPRPDCQIWSAAVDRGYGRISVGGVVYRVHRVVWELANGPIADGLQIDHVCRMELVTPQENIQRAIPFRPRSVSRRPKTHCKRGHEFTPENTNVRNNGWRECLECKRGWKRSEAVA